MGQPTMQMLAEKVMEASGLDYRLYRKALRAYVHSLLDDDFEEEVSRITNPKIQGVLWSIGLNSYQQEVIAKRMEELAK